MAQRAKTVQQEREEVYAALQYAASVRCWRRSGKTVRNLSRSQKKSGSTCKRNGRKQSIGRSGAPRPASVDARDVEEAAST